jgi:1-aminocyclopropane-1-carboxylate deaminase/D-cysteine desulfhydrase-like pyridoxal-dependent ACC family enzyme
VAQLRSQGRHPLLIPVGGSNALGTWGYIQAVNEILEHPHGRSMTDIVMVS